jgi:signal transduction histidine kinase
MASLPGALALLAGAHVGGEWSGRTMKNLLTQRGHRWRVLAAKLVSLWLAGVGLIAVCWLALAAAGPVLVHIDHLPAAHQSAVHALTLAGSQVARALLVLAAFAAIGLLAAVATRGTIGTTAATAVAIIAMLIAASLPGTGRWTPATWVQEWMGFPAGQASITSLPTNFWSRFISAGAIAAVLVGAYGLGAYASPVRRHARWLGWLSLAAALVVVITSNGVPNKSHREVLEGRLAGAPLALLGAAFVLGDAADARRREAAALVEAAHQAERTRIARELHDVVAHQLSAIAVQAGAARIAAGSAQVPAGSAQALAGGGSAPGDGQTSAGGQAPTGGQLTAGGGSAPGDGQASAGGQTLAEVLATVEWLAREALTELNHLLGALRREQAGDPARRPSPTLRELETLLDAARTAGVPADLTVEGGPRALSPGVELSCYRIIDEALTNVARHAPGAPTQVVLRYRPGGLDIEVANGPPPGGSQPAAPRPASGGRGVRGMRERAELYGGASGRCSTW